MQIHPEIEDRITKYFSQGMLNTIFYGGRGVGKHTLVLKMLNSGNHEKEKIRFWEDTGVRFYSTSTYIRFDAKECVRKKANLPLILHLIEHCICTYIHSCYVLSNYHAYLPQLIMAKL